MRQAFLFFALLISSFCEAKGEPLFSTQMEPSHIFVNNRILAQVNGKAISVFDVMKKMDLLFYRAYPEYSSSVPARFQFYQMHWRKALSEIIDKELIIADAEESKVEISLGDIRQEMEKQFGPNIIFNLDKAGLTFSEAQEMVKQDLLLEKMTGIKAHSKAIKRITPQVVKETYDDFAQKNIRPEKWAYTVITIRSGDEAAGLSAADFAYRYLTQEGELASLLSSYETSEVYDKNAKITISEPFEHQTKDLNEDYKKILTRLNPKSYSQPVLQKSRKESSKVYRIFYLDSHSEEGPIPFDEAANIIRNELIGQAAVEEVNFYLQKLRKHYHVHEEEMVADDFAPFILK